ncbi:MAG: hypothetical protein WDN75_15635 [Bacteroidota bacterium]
MLAVVDAAPDLAREQILLSASRQFKEGDVQHWWHPPQGRGVRTRCSDDMLWIAFTTSRYVSHTHDFAILNELVPFLEGRELNADQESNYDLPVETDQESDTLRTLQTGNKSFYSLRFTWSSLHGVRRLE